MTTIYSFYGPRSQDYCKIQTQTGRDLGTSYTRGTPCETGQDLGSLRRTACQTGFSVWLTFRGSHASRRCRAEIPVLHAALCYTITAITLRHHVGRKVSIAVSIHSYSPFKGSTTWVWWHRTQLFHNSTLPEGLSTTTTWFIRLSQNIVSQNKTNTQRAMNVPFYPRPRSV